MPWDESPRLLKDMDGESATMSKRSDESSTRKVRLDEEVYDDRVFYSNLIKVRVCDHCVHSC
jgi:hypothetical protein